MHRAQEAQCKTAGPLEGEHLATASVLAVYFSDTLRSIYIRRATIVLPTAEIMILDDILSATSLRHTTFALHHFHNMCNEEDKDLLFLSGLTVSKRISREDPRQKKLFPGPLLLVL